MADILAGADGLAGVVLAAGAGTRLQPLTSLRPKALCPVDNVPLVDLALAKVAAVTGAIAVNVHHGRALLESHLALVAPDVHQSIEAEQALGTAGALGHLRDWIAGRDVLVVNADAWHRADLGRFAADWDRERVRLLVVRDERGTWGDRYYAGAALMPWSEVAALEPVPSGLYEVSWRRLGEAGLDFWEHDGEYFDCGTPARYLAANLAASGGGSVVGPGAIVEGELDASVVWPGALVRRGERLRRAIRAHESLTVLVR